MCSLRSTPIWAGRTARRGLSEDQPALVALLDGLSIARGNRQGSFVAGDRANVPRKYASGDRQGGIASLSALPTAERALIAGSLQCPKDAYFDRFAASMGEHPGPPGDRGRIDRPRDARSLLPVAVREDETMAESIAGSFRSGTMAGPVSSCTSPGVSQRLRQRHAGTRAPAASRPSRGRAVSPSARQPGQPRAGRRRSQESGVPRLHDQMSCRP